MNKKLLYTILWVVSGAGIILTYFLFEKQNAEPKLALAIAVALLIVFVFSAMKRKKLTAVEMEAEDPEDAEDIPETPGEARDILWVEGFPSDRMYFVFATQTYYAFVHIGHAEFGVKEDAVPDKPLTDADRQHAGPKDLWLAKSEILDGTLKMKHCVSTQLPSCASLKLKTRDGKKYSFIILQELDEKTIRGFLADVEKRIS